MSVSSESGAERALILGAGGHCRAVIGVLASCAGPVRYRVEGVVDTDPPRKGEQIMGVPVLGGMDDLPGLLEQGIRSLFIAIGDNARRAECFRQVREIGFSLPTVIAANAWVDPAASYGEGNLICHRAHLGPLSSIGDGNIINTGAILEHESSLGSFCHMAPASVVSGRTRLGDHVFLGVNATVIDRVTLGSRLMIGAGAVVTRDISEDGGTYVGVPARRLER